MCLGRTLKGGIRMNTNISEKTCNIISGPNKDLLFDACKYAYDKVTKVTVGFTVTINLTSKTNFSNPYITIPVGNVVITGISHEDGSGEKFILDGHCMANLEISKPDLRRCHFKAYYNSKSRNGWIKFSE